MKKFYFLIILPAILLAACNNGPKNYTAEEIAAESKKANGFFEQWFKESVERSPEYQSYLGYKYDYDKWTNRSDAFNQTELRITEENLKLLKDSIHFEALDEQTKLSYRMYELNVSNALANNQWRFHNYPINQMGGFHSEMPSFLINIHTVADKKDAECYISRLEKIPDVFEQELVNLKIREMKKIIPPKFVFPQVLSDCKNILSGKPFDKSDENNAIYQDICTKIDSLKGVDATEKATLKTKAETALVTKVKPAYERLVAYLIELEKKATTDDGAWKFPDGKSFYNAAIKTTTTTDLTAEQIHELGKKEVARIQAEMRVIMKKVNFKNDNIQDFFTFLREDKQFYYPNTAEGKKAYMDKAVAIVDAMQAKLDALFITKPKAKMIVKAVEPFREKSAGGAFYQDPALDGSRPGTYYINLYSMADQPIYQMEALAYHEGIPGHHMQLSIAQELQGVPMFRKMGSYTAYVEGWGLYSELIPKELGFYSDPYSDFGRLSMEIFRAARLVVDTGIHYFKWTREDALKYFMENIPNPPEDCRKEIERYIVWPGQATGYKIGMLKILELREMAKKELGPKFDIREYHDVVLTNGALPLNLLEELVKDWVAKKKAA
jgi:uncharacterized protein (DUF885 family)